MTDPYDQYRSIPKVDRNSLTYRLYYTASACYGYLDENHPRQAELRRQINELIREYETSQMENHTRRN